ncbi:type III PLP-dependent enzyme [Entomobacter blattae]|uniref:L-glutamyl-[BtrI acyl-carrier protein] decarboxylase n=1 Tax=Entomobacter blattae TaxID=2762277 RepID=A0A7H1NTX7_9PROT|nr:type III PLP-dependent enzyme [Entomobacter blattae]QNT79237.1 L-glutamyl-[BtrI acyl-carrier protein] decarboxylase [Entomobacter blattae]
MSLSPVPENQAIQAQFGKITPAMEKGIAYLRSLQSEDNQAIEDPLCAFLYDLTALEAHAKAMQEGLPENCSIFFAVKANNEIPILKTLSRHVDGFEVASIGELVWIQNHVPHHRILFGGPGKTPTELRAALEANVEALHVESLLELQRLAKISQNLGRVAPVMLRLNLQMEGEIKSSLMMSGKPSQFGMDNEMVELALLYIVQTPSLKLVGLHAHTLSHHTDTMAHLELVHQHIRSFHRLREKFNLQIDLMNCGGGMGINYQDAQNSFNWSFFCEGLQKILKEEGKGIKLRFEIGRYLTAGCGIYIMEVMDIKKSHGKWFAIGRGGTHHFRLPSALGHDHPIIISSGGESPVVTNAPVSMVGQLCTPKDILARDVPVKQLAIGDFVIYPLAGAYGWGISHHDFLMHPPPLVYFLTPAGIMEKGSLLTETNKKVFEPSL